MSTRKSFMVAGATLIAATLALSACSSGGAQSAGSTGSGATGSTGAEEVVMWGSWSGSQVAEIEAQATAFNESQDQYHVSYVPQEQVEQKLLTAIAGGNVPDLVMWDRYQTALYAPKGALQNLDDKISADGVDTGQFYQAALSEMTSDGSVYGLPLLVDVRVVAYNKGMFDAAGLKAPTTWEELKSSAEALTVSEGGKLKTAGFLLNDPGLFNMWLLQAGGQLVTDDGSATAFNSPEGLEVMNFWKSLMDAGVYVNGFADTSDVFAAGQAAMKYEGPWAIPGFEAATGLEWAFTEPVAGPNGDKGAIMGGFGLVIPTGAKNSDGAWEFMKWWASQPENGVEFGKISGWIPANRDAANDPYFTENPAFSAFISTLDFASVRPSTPGYSDVEGKALTPALQKFMSGELTAEQALSQAQQQGDQILQGAK